MMRTRETALPGVVTIAFPSHADGRGAFARLWCADSFGAAGIEFSPTQCSLSSNTAALTLRGLHWQAPPHGEAKLVRCLRGRMFDVAVDLRAGSPTFGRWTGAELSPGGAEALFIPAGCAHGFLTLEPHTDVLYLIDTPYVPDASRGMMWNDPDIGVDWPAAPAVVGERDAALPAFSALLAAGDLPC